MTLLVWCWLLLQFTVLFAFRTQSVAVKGKLLCGAEPATQVLVKLVDKDGGPDPDDCLAQGKTSRNGQFHLNGSALELTPIDPQLRIYHDCNDRGRPCQREWVIQIPSKYIFTGANAKEIMNLGIINLEVELENEDQDCLH